MMTKPAIKNTYSANKIYLTYIMLNDKNSTQANITSNVILSAQWNITKTKTRTISIKLAHN